MEPKFRAWDKNNKIMENVGAIDWGTQKVYFPKKDRFGESSRDRQDFHNVILIQYTGLKDKNGKEGYFDSDVWEIKDYEYSVNWCGGFKVQRCNLRFMLKQGLLETEYELLTDVPNRIGFSLKTIFNLPLKSGDRMYVDDNRQKLEIIGNIHENPELLNGKEKTKK